MQRFQVRPVTLMILLAVMAVATFVPVAPNAPLLTSPAVSAAGTNPITVENAQPGSTGWQFDFDNSGNPLKATNHEIEGYASLTSVNKGGQIDFKVSLSSAAQYTMQIYRMGYYPTGTNPDGSACSGPCGGRLLLTTPSLTGSKQAACPTTTTTTNFGLIECAWAPSYTLTVPTTWTTGNYIVKLQRSDTKKQAYMTFVVRDDAGSADFVLSMDVTTWQAYNFWGGAGNNNVGYNLYGKFNDVTFATLSGTPPRAYAVSFDRPYLVQGAQDGAGNFMVWDYPLVRWLEKQGYNVTYATDVDIETSPGLLSGRKAFLNTGHDEYYSANMRANLQGYINGGAHMGFFSANNVYNQIRWQNSAAGQPYRRVICYKDQTLDPQTIRWRDLTPPQPENALLGVMQNGVADSRAYRVYDASHWIYAGTGLVNYVSGTPITSGAGQNAIAGLIGYEFDERAKNVASLSSYVSAEPAGLQQVGHSAVPSGDNGVAAFSDAIVYTASSGAIVFSAGTIQWSWGLDNGFNDGYCDCNPGFANSKSQQITANILNKFLATSTGSPAPAVTLSPTSLTFSGQTVGTTSAAQAVTLTNSGNAALTISGITVTGTDATDFAQTTTCPVSPATIAVNGTCTISVSFTPAAAGSRTASVSITDNAIGSPQSVALSGTGTQLAPAVTLSPTSLSFGSQPVGTTSAAQSVTLTNSGTAPLTISSIGLAGTNAGDFAQSNACPSTLAVGASCTISVTFAPGATGSRSASISITDAAAGSPRSVALSGTGTQPAPAVTLTPTSLGFGNQRVGTTSAAQTVTLTNSGNAALTISGITVTGTNPGDFALAPNPTCPIAPSTLAAGASCTISVTFTPSATGARAASVSVADDVSGSPQSIPLSGTGTQPAVTLTPASLAFGSQTVATTSPPQSVTLKNTGTAALTVTSITITPGANADDFALAPNPTCPIAPSTLAAGAICTISVTFTPSATGARAASVSVADDASGSPHTLALSGIGAVPGAIAFDKNLGTKTDNLTSGTMTMNTAAAATAGSRVFVFVNWTQGTRTLTAVTGGGLTWTIDTQAKATNSTIRAAIASAPAPSGLPANTPITATFSGAVTHGLIAAASFTGVAATSPLDGAVANTQAGVTGWTCSVPTTNPNDLVLGWSGIDWYAATGNSTPATPNVEIHDIRDGNYYMSATSAYHIESSAGTKTVNGTWSGSALSTSNLTLCAGYKSG